MTRKEKKDKKIIHRELAYRQAGLPTGRQGRKGRKGKLRLKARRFKKLKTPKSLKL